MCTSQVANACVHDSVIAMYFYISFSHMLLILFVRAATLYNTIATVNTSFSVPFQKHQIYQTSIEVNTLADDMIVPSPNGSNTTAILPRQRLGIGAEMKVRVIAKDRRGREMTKGGAMVRCSMDSKGCVDEGNGTYLLSVIPRQLGYQQLSITIDNQHIQNSPFSLTIVPQRDYTKLIQPVQTINDVRCPINIAFSNNDDLFVTSNRGNCVYVYDKNGNKKTTIGSKGSGELQFKFPYGIDINGDIVYVCECNGHRIHKLTTLGEFITTFGDKGTENGSEHGSEEEDSDDSEDFEVGVNRQFNHPCDVKISPDNKIYVSDVNDTVQVFHSDWTISHVINGCVSGDGGFSEPEGIAFDLSGNVHVTGYDSVTVFTPNGQFIRQYNTTHIFGPRGIAIDPSGYSLLTNWDNNGTLAVFDPNGVLIHSVRGLNRPWGVSVANDGGVWVADYNRLVKY